MPDDSELVEIVAGPSTPKRRGSAATAPRITWAELPLDGAVRNGTGDLKLAVFSGADCP